MIKVMVVEDSVVVRMLLAHLLNSDPQIQVIATAGNGREALGLLAKSTPDVVLMDIEMPEMDGFETTRRIMETRPVPIIVCGGSGASRESLTTFRLLEAGALACVEKPSGAGDPNYQARAAHLIGMVKLMSEVKVVRRWPQQRRPAGAASELGGMAKEAPVRIDVVGIGASTGGPPALRTILTGLTTDFPAPILIVQHIAAGFVSGMAQWLAQSTPCPIHLAADGQELLPGNVYLAPDDFHMGIGPGGRVALRPGPLENGLRPSVAHLFRSLCEVCGPRAAGVLLTGMGKDGARELRQMKDLGALTIAQDRESCVVYGMPGEAAALEAATYILPIDQIASALLTAVRRQFPTGGKS